MNRINISLLDEKTLNKRNKNLDSYKVSENSHPDDNNISETPHNFIWYFHQRYRTNFARYFANTSNSRERLTSINPIPDFTIGFASPDGQSSNVDTIYEKIKIQGVKVNIIQNLRENISEIFDAKHVNFIAQYEGLVKRPCANYNNYKTN